MAGDRLSLVTGTRNERCLRSGGRSGDDKRRGMRPQTSEPSDRATTPWGRVPEENAARRRGDSPPGATGFFSQTGRGEGSAGE
jgi:hypothetical protein